MKIGLNATCFNERPSGAKQRLLGLYLPTIRAMADVKFIVYLAGDVDTSFWFEELNNVSIRRTPIRSEGRWGRIISGLAYWPKALLQDRVDLFEGFHLPPIGNPSGKTLLTIHDVRGVHAHTQYSNKPLYQMVLKRSVLRSDVIITVSDTMRQEILSLFPNARIKRIYNGIDVHMFDRVNENDVEQYVLERQLPSDFLLSIGHYEIRKNYSRLIDAIALLKTRGFSIPLVIAGNDSGQYDKLQRKVVEAGLESQIILLKNLNDQEIRLLYRACRMFIFPSAYEGFGIPLLEAMAAGKPFLLSDIAVFRELSENKGSYFRYDDIGAMAQGIEALAGSHNEQERLIKYGGTRVTDFSYENLSQELISLYQSQI